jgi:hypothetical protein
VLVKKGEGGHADRFDAGTLGQTRIIVATAEGKCSVFRSVEGAEVLQLCSEFVRGYAVVGLLLWGLRTHGRLLLLARLLRSISAALRI